MDPRPKLPHEKCYWCTNDTADPVFYEQLDCRTPLYCFFDEMWNEVHAGWGTEEDARMALKEYGDSL